LKGSDRRFGLVDTIKAIAVQALLVQRGSLQGAISGIAAQRLDLRLRAGLPNCSTSLCFVALPTLEAKVNDAGKRAPPTSHESVQPFLAQ